MPPAALKNYRGGLIMEGPLRGCLAGCLEVGRRLLLDDPDIHNCILAPGSCEMVK